MHQDQQKSLLNMHTVVFMCIKLSAVVLPYDILKCNVIFKTMSPVFIYKAWISARKISMQIVKEQASQTKQYSSLSSKTY